MTLAEQIAATQHSREDLEKALRNYLCKYKAKVIFEATGVHQSNLSMFLRDDRDFTLNWLVMLATRICQAEKDGKL